ncbi:MAG: endonuclease III [Campylobacterota bacterium]|nr:endonuclease III [Campylobacterota bacterium]
MKKATKKEIEVIKEKFLERFDGAVSELEYKNAYELVVVVALSAQCTDKRVNVISPALFERYPDVYELANADLEEVKSFLNTCSFFNNKAKNIIKMAKRVVEVYSGEIPLVDKELVTLAGVGQKTANVVLIEHSGANLMAVDTHVFRVSHRLGLSDDVSALKTEKTLERKLKDNLHILHQAMVLFGRYTCTAINPKCEECFLNDECKTKKSFKAK